MTSSKAKAPPAPPDSAPNSGTYELLSIHDIQPNPRNPRTHFDEAALEELSASLKAHGMIEPLVVRPLAQDELEDPAQDPASASAAGPTRYELVVGERRWRAAPLAGLEAVPCLIRQHVPPNESLRLALVENLQRVDLDPLEEAQGYRALADLGWKQQQIADAVHRSQPAIANTLRLLDLPEDVQSLVHDRKLSQSHALALANLKGFPAAASLVGAYAIANALTSHQVERWLDLYALREQLEKKHLLIELRNPPALFDTTVCPTCPYNAYRKGIYAGYCLKPAHFFELQEEAKERRREAAELLAAQSREAVARAEAAAAAAVPETETGQENGHEPPPAAPAAPALPRLQDLSYNTYLRLGDYGSAPEGCDAHCPCRGYALANGDQQVALCLDQARYRKLQAAQTRRDNKARSEARKDLVQQLQSLIDEIQDDGVGRRELGILVAEAVGRLWYAPEAGLKPAAERQGLSLPHLSAYEAPRRLARTFAQVEPDRLVRFAVEALLRSEILDPNGGDPARARWYLGDEHALALREPREGPGHHIPCPFCQSAPGEGCAETCDCPECTEEGRGFEEQMADGVFV